MLERRGSALSELTSVSLICTDEELARIRAASGPQVRAIVASTPHETASRIRGGDTRPLLIGAAAVPAAEVGILYEAMEASDAEPPPVILLATRADLPRFSELIDLAPVHVIEPPLDAVMLQSALSWTQKLRQQTERCRRAEEAARGSDALLQYALDLSRQIVWTMDPEFNELAISGRTLHQLTGSSPKLDVGELVEQFMHPEDRAEALPAFREALKAGREVSFEFRLRATDGSYHSFRSRALPRFNEEGVLERWYGFIEDITDQRAAMEALRQAEERYRLAARATNDAIWDWNLPTGTIAWSDAAAAYLGNVALENSSIGWWENAIHPDDQPRVVRSLNRAIESDKSRWSAAYRLRKVDGDYAYVYDRGFIIRDDTGQAVRAVGAVVDLTERRRAEAELRRTQAELIHISRVSAMGTMASTLAHELNQPLTAVTSYVRGSRRLLAGFDDPAVVQVCEALEFAEAGALRAGQIVRRLREMVARGAVEVGREDLASLVQDASVLAFVDEHLHGITHRIDIEPAARWVEVDRIQIQQVLINLIRNSIQALQNSEVREISISARLAEDEMVEVSVADTGTGIPDSVRDALFSPFHSTKAEGMGIGLSICRTIVEAHHGRIWARDGAKGGAIFSFTLPRADAPPDSLADAVEEEAGPTL